jgi:hypothetical protein
MIESNGFRRRAARESMPAARTALQVCVLVLMLGPGCTHHTDAVHELNSAVAPFTQSRDEAVQLVTNAKHVLGASDLNTLAVDYSALQDKGNAYAGFLTESVATTSMDAGKNAEDATALAQAIKTFNKSFAAISPASLAGASVKSAWIPAFSDSVTAYWKQYQSALAGLSPQTKADLIKELKAKTVWPNYENIATEPLSTPAPH